MTIEERLYSALSALGLPLAFAVFQGNDTEYIVFQYVSLGSDFADDEPGHERYLIQVHYYAPLSKNTSRMRRRVQKALFDADFTWPETFTADDKDGRHIVFECEAAGRLENGDLSN